MNSFQNTRLLILRFDRLLHEIEIFQIKTVYIYPRQMQWKKPLKSNTWWLSDDKTYIRSSAHHQFEPMLTIIWPHFDVFIKRFYQNSKGRKLCSVFSYIKMDFGPIITYNYIHKCEFVCVLLYVIIIICINVYQNVLIFHTRN